MTDGQMSRRFWLVIHDVLVHPFTGLCKALSPSTKPEWASRLHDATLPPLPRCDERMRDGDTP